MASSESSGRKRKLTWEESYDELKEYHGKHGHCKVPSKYPRLGMWVVNQRAAATLTQEQTNLLNEIDFHWETKEERFERQWHEMFQCLKQHIRAKGPGASMADRGYFSNDRKLKGWVGTQQTKYRRGTIRQDRKEKLESIGFLWVRDSRYVGVNRDVQFFENKWNTMFERLSLFKDETGHCMVQPDEDDLHKWVHRHRVMFKEGTLRDDRKEKLDEIGFVWEMTDHCDADASLKQREWDDMYDRLVEFHRQYGHTRVPRGYGPDVKLATWVSFQRCQLKAGNMDERRVEKLQSLGLESKRPVDNLQSLGGFTSDVHEEQWNDMYEQLVEYKRKYGHCRVLYGDKDNPGLGEWVVGQRSALKGVKNTVKLRPDRKAKLDEIGFVWDAQEDKWYRMFDRLAEYRRQHGDCLVPDKYDLDQRLANWVRRQRSLLRGTKPGGMPRDRRSMLDDINFVWDPLTGGAGHR